MNGLLVIDKPGGMTSRDAVNRVQRWFPRKTKIGHTGTLDPLATGVLVVCVGAATRLADLVQAMGKTYHSRFRLGATSTTDDADGEVTATPDAVPPPRERIDAALAGFVGVVSQTPPAFSAMKVSGQRAHALARRGEAVELAARPVRVDTIRVVGDEWPFLDVEIDCGKGTYIRSIARDLGATLGCGGMVETLRRTRVGPFRAEDGVSVDGDPEAGRGRLMPMAKAVDGLPREDVSEDDARRFRHGQPVSGRAAAAGLVAVFGPGGELVGLADGKAGALKPTVVLADRGP